MQLAVPFIQPLSSFCRQATPFRLHTAQTTFTNKSGQPLCRIRGDNPGPRTCFCLSALLSATEGSLGERIDIFTLDYIGWTVRGQCLVKKPTVRGDKIRILRSEGEMSPSGNYAIFFVKSPYSHAQAFSRILSD